MKKLLFCLLVVSSLAISGCISSVVPDDNPSKPEIPDSVPVLKTFNLRLVLQLMEDLKTPEKINTYAYPYLSNIKTPPIYWGSSDHAGIFVIGDNDRTLYANREYDINKDASAWGSRVAVLRDTITTAAKNASCYGYFPYQPAFSENTITRQLNSVQNQSASTSTVNYMDTLVSENLLMLSSAGNSFPLSEGTCELNFESLFSILRFQIKKASLTVPFGNQRITKSQLYIAKKNEWSVPLPYVLAGEYKINIAESIGTSSYKGPEFTPGKSSNTITATVTEGNYISEYDSQTPYLWFVVNPVKIKTDECLVLLVETERQYRIVSVFDLNDSELKANNAYSFSVVADQTNTVSDINIVTHYPDEKASNCYIVSQPGICQIPLKTISGSTLRGNSVDWLWASKENGGSNFEISELIDPSSINYNESGNYIRFRVGTILGQRSKGNVVLALKNTAGDIVWSWHIWITDEPQDTTYYLANGTTKKFIDRNIGATSAETVSPWINNYGFVYQWGRKDPFIGGDGNYDEASTTVLAIATNNSIVNNSGNSWPAPRVNQADATFAMQYPMTFICNNTAPTNPIRPFDNPKDWLSVSGVAYRWTDTNKTDNDPCPYGYKVPGTTDLSVLYVPKMTNWYFENAKEKTDSENRYWVYVYNNTRRAVWPAAGMRQGRSAYGFTGGQLRYSGTEGAVGQCFYWTSTPATTRNGIIIPGGSHRVYTSGLILYDQDDFGDNADAYPVRCIKIN